MAWAHRVCVVLLAGLLVSGCAEPGGPRVLRLEEAQFLPGARATPPPMAPGWRSLRLGDRWKDDDRLMLREGWYRFSLPAGIPAEPASVYLPRLNMNASIWLNGEFLGDGGRFAEPVARWWNTPMLHAVPRSLWRADASNELAIRLRSYPGYGALAAPLVGPTAVLAPAHAARRFFQNDLNVGLAIVVGAISAFMFGLWRLRPGDTQYFWFGVSTASLMLFTINQFLIDIPIPAKAWWGLMHWSLELYAVTFAIFLLRTAGERRPVFETLMWTLVATTAIVMVFVPFESIGPYTSATSALKIGFAIYATAFHVRNWRRGDRDAPVYVIAVAMIVAVALHDVLLRISFHVTPSESGLLGIWQHDQYLMNYLAVLAFIGIAWHLVRRFARALDASERLNRELEERVADARDQLRNAFAEREALERERAVQGERDRIYADLHDDLGSKILSLVYRTDEEGRDIARTALADLRDIVSRRRAGPVPLEEVLADWQDEVRSRADRAGLAFDWHLQTSVPPGRDVPEEWRTQMGRVLREACTNVLRHGHPSWLGVSVRCNEDIVEVAVESDGAASPPEAWEAGRGLHSMRRRVAALGGEIDWTGGCDGRITTRWRVPRTAANPLPNADRLQGA